MRAVVKVTETCHDDSEDEFARDEEFTKSAAKRQSPIREDSEIMRSERENYITGLEAPGKVASTGNINHVIRSERTPNLEHDRIKGIMQTEGN